MNVTIVVSRKTFVFALLVASLLAIFVIGSRWAFAQDICEYARFTGVCIDRDGSIRIVGDPLVECKSKEEPAYLLNKDHFYCLRAAGAALEGRVAALEERFEACNACNK